MDRRVFFKQLLRTGFVAGLIGVSAIALYDKSGEQGQSRLAGIICNGCSKSGNCSLPKDQVANNIQHSTCTARTISNQKTK
jgi:hypothetical protein